LGDLGIAKKSSDVLEAVCEEEAGLSRVTVVGFGTGFEICKILENLNVGNNQRSYLVNQLLAFQASEPYQLARSEALFLEIVPDSSLDRAVQVIAYVFHLRRSALPSEVPEEKGEGCVLPPTLGNK